MSWSTRFISQYSVRKESAPKPKELEAKLRQIKTGSSEFPFQNATCVEHNTIPDHEVKTRYYGALCELRLKTSVLVNPAPLLKQLGMNFYDSTHYAHEDYYPLKPKPEKPKQTLEASYYAEAGPTVDTTNKCSLAKAERQDHALHRRETPILCLTSDAPKEKEMKYQITCFKEAGYPIFAAFGFYPDDPKRFSSLKASEKWLLQFHRRFNTYPIVITDSSCREEEAGGRIGIFCTTRALTHAAPLNPAELNTMFRMSLDTATSTATGTAQNPEEFYATSAQPVLETVGGPGQNTRTSTQSRDSGLAGALCLVVQHPRTDPSQSHMFSLTCLHPFEVPPAQATF